MSDRPAIDLDPKTYEVKLTVDLGVNSLRTFTIASFESPLGYSARASAIAWSTKIDPGYAVDVICVEDEDNREKSFGLVYHRDAVI